MSTTGGWTWFRFPMSLYKRLPEMGRATAVLVVLAKYSDESGKSFPSHATIAAESGVPERTVRAHLELLESNGIITKKRRRRATTIYTIVDPFKNGNGQPFKDSENGNPQPFLGVKNGRNEQLRTAAHGRGTIPEEPYQSKKHNKGAAFAAVIPAILDNEDFRSAWGEYVKHRREKRSALTPTAAARALKKLEAIGPARAVAALEHSISNGWTGIFEPPPNGNGKMKQTIGSGQRHPADAVDQEGVF